MSKVYYVTCPKCLKKYYMDELLYKIVIKNPKQNLKCPYCKSEFKSGGTFEKK